MKLYQRIASYALIGLWSLGLFECAKTDTQNNHPKPEQTIERKVEYFKDRGIIGGGYNDFSGVSRIAIGDVNQDGRQDVILTDRFARVAYIENSIPQKNQE